MAKTVAEIMERQFVYASRADSIPGLLRRMAGACVASVPVLDLAGRPIGKATVCDIEKCHHVEEIEAGRIRSLISVSQNTSIDAAARTLAQGNADSLVVLDEQGVAVGMVSAAELLRAVLGLACSHQDELPVTRRAGRWWNHGLLELDAVQHTAAAPGVIMLTSTADAPDVDRIRWIEVSENVRERLDAMLRLPQADPTLEGLLAADPRTLRFRVVIAQDSEQRARLSREPWRGAPSGVNALAEQGRGRPAERS